MTADGFLISGRYLQLVKSVYNFLPLIDESTFEQVKKPLYVEIGVKANH